MTTLASLLLPYLLNTWEPLICCFFYNFVILRMWYIDKGMLDKWSHTVYNFWEGFVHTRQALHHLRYDLPSEYSFLNHFSFFLFFDGPGV
jgi:hypothetical protein